MIEIERGSGNVYADLNMPNAQAMLLKAQLAAKIGKIIKSRGWSQQQATAVLGLTQPKLSNLLRGQFRGISEARLLECLVSLGYEVKIVISPARQSSDQGRIGLVFA